MAEIKVGDRVRVQNRTDWPTPPGYILANSEGTVTKWIESDVIMEEFKDFAYVQLEKAEGDAQVYIGRTMFFPVEQLEKI